MTGHALARNWQPSIEDRYYGRIRLGLSDAAIEDMAEDMRLWAGANANRQIARKSNWSMAFKGWMRREAAKQGKSNAGNRIGNAFDQIGTYFEGQAGPASPSGTAGDAKTGSGAGQETFGFLPP